MKTIKDLVKRISEVSKDGWKIRVENTGELNNLISLRVWKSGNDDKYIVREDFIDCVDFEDICDGIDSIIDEWEEVFGKDEPETMTNKVCVRYLENIKNLFVRGSKDCKDAALELHNQYISAIDYAITKVVDSKEDDDETN